jgi:hypothetical protein
MRKAGTYKKERVITSAQSAHITVNTSDKPVLVRAQGPWGGRQGPAPARC